MCFCGSKELAEKTPTPFVHLHNHSDYSLLDGASRIDRMVDTALSMGMPALALTDHGNLYGALQFYNTARKKGLKPIIGCEIYVAKESRHKKTGGGDQSNHLVLLAENLTGYHNLSRLASYGFIEGFYYKPRIDKELLSQYHEGLIALSACLKGAVPQKLAMGEYEGAVAEALELRDIFGEGNFYLELQDHGLEAQRRVNPSIIEISKKTGIPLICSNDTHYIRRDDSVAHDVLLCIGTGKLVSQQDRMRYESDQFYFKSYEEMKALWGEIPESLLNTVRIAERCDLQIETSQPLPPFDVPPGYDADSYFEKVSREGFRERRTALEVLAPAGKLKHTLAEYEERLSFEIEMIKKMRFSSYFLIVWDLLKYARDHAIPVGPGRGSVVGSLVAYSMKITDVDPLQYELFFERFLNPERIAPPDIDMDFCMNRRAEVIEYVSKKYGRDCVCQIITFGTMAARGVIRDVGRSLDIPYADVDRIAKLIPGELNATIDKALEQESRLTDEMNDPQIAKLIEIGKRLEGLSRHSSTHAAGVVIAPKPLIELIPLQKTNKDEITTQYSMKELESIGLLKMDFLALTTLTVIDSTVKRIREEKGIDVDLASVPLTDPEVFALFSEGRTNGVFQFESGGMKAELRRLKPERFEDLIALNALYRPGPMDMIPDFIKRKQGLIEVEYPHPILEGILKETYGVIVYQEQVMQIASKMAGFSLGEADILRKAMGKKLASVMVSMREKFIAGAKKNNISEKEAVQVFDLMEQFAQYGFNKSHATAYALLAYQTAYLKVHYPVQFMAALLTSEIGNTEKIVMYIAECKDMGIPVLPPDINESALDFLSLDGKIRFGMLAIRNVGEAAIRSVLEYRDTHGRFRSLFHFCEEVDSRSLNKRVLESLVKSGALDSLGLKRSQCMAMIDMAIEYGQKVRRDRESGQKGLFGSLSSGDTAMPEPPPPDIPEWPLEQRLAFEKETLGFYVSGHPLDRFAEAVSRFSDKSIAELISDAQTTECKVAGIVTDFRPRRTKKGDLMAIFTLEDMTAAVETVVFPASYPKFEPYMTADFPLLVTGRFEVEDERGYKLIASDLQPLSGICERNAKTLCIKAKLSGLSERSATLLHGLLEKNPGNTGVEVELYHPSKFRVNIRSSDFVKVKSSPELIQQIESICGPGSVHVVD
ncbi:MAG: DNA polymerase III subunit alpha [Acidobacteria bacterium]|nr:DNA polymerase III subunit alpha [Acidobacteriota bacterium]